MTLYTSQKASAFGTGVTLPAEAAGLAAQVGGPVPFPDKDGYADEYAHFNVAAAVIFLELFYSAVYKLLRQLLLIVFLEIKLSSWNKGFQETERWET